MTKPKILVITSSYPKFKGDVNGNFVYELSVRLIHDFDIFVLAPEYNGSLSFEIIDGIKIYRHKQFFLKNIELAYGSDILAKTRKNYFYLFIIPFYIFYQFISLSRIIKKEKIQLIHAHWLIPQALIAVLYKNYINSNIKIICTAHGADINSFNNVIGNWLKKYTIKRLDEFTVVSNALKSKVIEIGYTKKVFVFPMGVDTNLFAPSKKDEKIRKKYNISGYFLLFVGGLIERKGIRYLIQAMPLIISKFTDAKLVVIGEGNLKHEMIKLARTLNISENILFLGFLPHDELPAYFATADIFILPSLSEGFGLVVSEAISSGTLTIASNLRPINDIIIENKTGFYLDSNNPVGISKKIIEVIEKQDHFTNLRSAGREHIKNNFDWGIVSRNYKGLLNKLV